MNVCKVPDMCKDMEYKYITEDSKTRVYLSVVRKFNEAEYEKYYIRKKKEKVRKRILFIARALKYALPVLAMMVGQRKSEKEKIDRRLHNTDLLLRNYRTLKASYENAVYKSKEGEVTEVLEDIMTMKDDKVIVESIKTSAKRTAIMVQHIDKMLDVYRIYCSKLSEKDKRRYKIIKALYISKTPMTIAEISKKFSVSKVTVYEDIKIAKERLSSLFFGIDGLKFF